MNLETLVLPLKTEDNAFRAGISRVVQLVGGAIDAMEGMVKATFKWADEMDSLQDVMGITNKQAAALNFTLRKSGTQTETLSKGMTILEKGLVKADGSLDTTGKALKAWGINVLDANGKLKDQATLIGDITTKYASFGTQQEKVNFLTETFGRSGAELVDFFDTLAAEGGIDAVTKKVEAFGLAIDPNRYEQFNRNLEELKLIGTGLAVQFTERLMPVLEKFMGFFTEFAVDPDVGKALSKIDSFVSGVINGMATKINTWVQSGGPEQLSEDIISWVDHIGEGGDMDSKAATAMGRLFTALGNAVTTIDWGGILSSIDTKIGESVASHDWQASGNTVGTAIATAFSTAIPTAMEANRSSAVQSIGRAIVSWFTGAAGPENIAAFNMLEDQITQQIRSTLLGAFGKGTAGLGEKQIFYNIAFSMVSAMTGGLASNIGNFYGQIATVGSQIASRLGDIAKTFFNAATRWGAQMKAGFADGLPGLLSAVRGLVQSINGVLKAIITSFAISIKLPSWLTGIPGVSTGGGGTTGGGVKPPKKPGRASGGPVIAGQDYNVAEFFRPEVFTPASNGRIDSMNNNKPVELSDRSIIKLAEELSRVMPSVMTKALATV